MKSWIVAASAALALLSVARFAWLAPGLVEAQVVETRWALVVEARATRVATLAAVHEEGGRILGEVGAWRKEATGVILELGTRADVLLTKTEWDANARLQEVTALRGDVKPVLDELAKTVAAPRESFVNAGLIARSIRVAMDANMDPKQPTSWPSRVTGIMGSANTLAGESALTARSWRKATPELATSIAGTASNVKEMTKPRRWIWKVIPVAGAVIGGIMAAKK
jgi:hypothetical protein